MEIKRVLWALGITAVIGLLVAAAPPASRSRPILATPDGGTANAAGTAGGTAIQAHVPMCFSDSCVQIDTAALFATGSVTLTAGVWYEITATADGSGGQIGCWGPAAITGTDAGALCTGKAKLKEGVKAMAFANTNYDDAGIPLGTTTRYFFATQANATNVTLCPQVACQ